MKQFLITAGVVLLIAVLCGYVYFSFFTSEPEYIDLTSNVEGATIQPAEAVQIAQPYLEEHATVVFNEEEPLKTHIVSYKNWYYIMKTNYPAKTFRYYMQPAVKVNMTTGEVEFATK